MLLHVYYTITIQNLHFSIVQVGLIYTHITYPVYSVKSRRWVGWGMWHKWGRRGTRDEFWCGSLKETDVHVYGRMIIKWF